MNARLLRFVSGRVSGIRRAALGAVLLTMATASPASAQIFTSSGVGIWTTSADGGAIFGTDSAFDPVNQRALLVASCYQSCAFGSVYGTFVNRSGTVVSGKFPIKALPATAFFPRVRYFDQGGIRGFMVVWYEENVGVFAIPLNTDGMPMASESLISNNDKPSTAAGAPGIAYSPTTDRFLVVWPNITLQRVKGRLINRTGAPVGPGVFDVASGFSQAYYTAATWNSADNLFGVSAGAENPGMGFSVFVSVSPIDGSSSRQTFNSYPIGVVGATDIDYNPSTNRYLMTWWQGAAGTPAEVRVAEIDTAGNVVTTGMISRNLPGYNSLSMSFNQASGTYLIGSLALSDESVGIELNSRGFRNSNNIILAPGTTSYYGRVSSNRNFPEWNFTFSNAYASARNFVVTTSSTNGGASGSHPSPGGTPPPTPGPTPTPTPPSGGCNGPDPFAGIPGLSGTCVNGNWIPVASAPAPAPTPTPPPPPAPPPSSGCIGPDPFVTIGGGTCINGNWIPGAPVSAPPPPPPPPPTTGCTTVQPDPSWVCVNGGWLPPGLAPSCPGPDPFLSIGGGVCVGGAWYLPGTTGAPTGGSSPSQGGCIGPDPFVGIPGMSGTCINGNWIPNGG